jgi:hypothetical protein
LPKWTSFPQLGHRKRRNVVHLSAAADISPNRDCLICALTREDNSLGWFRDNASLFGDVPVRACYLPIDGKPQQEVAPGGIPGADKVYPVEAALELFASHVRRSSIGIGLPIQ